MLQKLYEQIDSKVLTADVRESLEREFAAAVDSRASAIADSRVEEIEAELQEQQQQHIRELDEASEEYQRKLEAELNERYAEAEKELNQHKLMLNEKAQQYIDERLAQINHQIDLYASRVAEDVTEDLEESLTTSAQQLKAQAMYDALCTFASLAGHNLGLEIDQAAKEVSKDYNNRISNLIEANRQLQAENKALRNNLIFERNTADLTMRERERMRMSLSGLIDTADEQDLEANLMSIKESLESEPELDFEADAEAKRKGGISDLLFKNI